MAEAIKCRGMQNKLAIGIQVSLELSHLTLPLRSWRLDWSHNVMIPGASCNEELHSMVLRSLMYPADAAEQDTPVWQGSPKEREAEGSA